MRSLGPKIVTPNACVDIINDKQPRLVAIDGFLGGGKTTLADALSRRSQYLKISLDDYILDREGDYLARLNYAKLKRDLEISSDLPTVVEGIFVTEVLGHLEVQPNLVIAVQGLRPRNVALAPNLAHKLQQYLLDRSFLQQVDFVVNYDFERASDRAQIDIAYIKSKTMLAIVLAIGGMMAIGVGLVVFVLGVKGEDTTLLRLAGFEMSSKGLGAVILATSSVWAYLSYLSRPKYSHSRERRINTAADGSSNILETESSTVVMVRERD